MNRSSLIATDRGSSYDSLKFSRLLTAPLFFSGLVVENTSRCNAKCAMCYQSAGPKGSDLWGKARLSVEEIAPVILETAEIEAVYPRFHLSGGEAFLDPKSCFTLFEVAKTAGFLHVTTTTNAYWARNARKALEMAIRLREVGVTNIEISWDYWHQPYIPAEAVSNCIEACYEADVDTNLRILSTKSHSYSEALGMLNPVSVEKATKISCGPVFPSGRAATEIPPDQFHAQDNLDSACFSMLNLTVNARGNVFPCCAGIDQTNNHLFGNVRTQSIKDIFDSMNRSWLLRALVVGGVSTLLPILERSGIRTDSTYKSMCHMCWSIFSQPQYVRAIEAFFDDLQKQALSAGILGLEKAAATNEIDCAASDVSAR